MQTASMNSFPSRAVDSVLSWCSTLLKKAESFVTRELSEFEDDIYVGWHGMDLEERS